MTTIGAITTMTGPLRKKTTMTALPTTSAALGCGRSSGLLPSRCGRRRNRPGSVRPRPRPGGRPLNGAAGSMAGKKRIRDVPLYVWVRPDELEAIRGRMEEAGIRNMSAYIRKMALNGYILHVDLSPVQELVSLQRRCANNLNQVALHANSYGVYQEEIKSLQKDYADLWGPLSELLEKLSLIIR